MMTYCYNRSKKRLRHSQNVTVSTQSVSESTADMPSPIFPEEIIIEILLRLPVRSLLQFRCVCKFWKTLISDPQFAKKHNLSSTAYPQLISVFVSIANCHHVSYPLKPLLENPSTPVEPAIFKTRYATSVIGSCNGLLCLYDTSLSYYFKLWNPSIKLKSKKSPTINCFDCKRMLYCGFGYDQVNDRYKVLAVLRNGNDLDETKTIVYTFGEKSWKTVQNFPCDPRRDPDDMWLGKFVSGNLNWIVNEDVIVSFDLEKETYGEILLPKYDGGNPVLYVSGNHICVSFVHSKKTHWVVWMMKEYGVVESWTKLMIIPQDTLTSDVGNSRLSDALFISIYGVLLLRPNLYKLTVYKLNNDGGLDYRTTIFGKFAHGLHIYHESLVSPHWLKHSQKKNKRKRKQRLGSQSPELVSFRALAVAKCLVETPF